MRPLYAVVAGLAVLLGGCAVANADFASDGPFVREPNALYPTVFRPDGQLGSGHIDGNGPVQPVAYSHNTHVVKLGMDCQYCHSVARRSRHAGVPPAQACMGCHKYVKADSPRVAKVAEMWNAKEPMPWVKVHDAPDFVNFSHKRHVRAGVDCLECHGQIPEQGQNMAPVGGAPAGASAVEGETPEMWANGAENVMIRQTTMQMGWCLDCHATHPSIDTNYGDKANLRRAELKDCWTCHM